MSKIKSSNNEDSFKPQSVRVKFKSFSLAGLEDSVRMLVLLCKQNGYEISGPIPLPVKSKKITVVRSPHVNGSSKERFVCDTHTRVLECIISNSAGDNNVNHIFENLNLPAGIGVEIKVFGYNQQVEL